MRKFLISVLVLLLLSTNLSASYVTDLEDTVIKQEEKITVLEKDNAVMKEKIKAKYLIRVPFTDIGVTNDHGQGFIVGVIVMVII